MTGWIWRAAVCAALMSGCGDETPESRPEERPPPAEDEGPPGPLVRHETFELRASPAGTYTAGERGSFEIRLLPRGGYHVNTDPRFPFSIQVSGPEGVELPKTAFDRNDAAEFGEERARFDVPVVPRAAGQHEVRAIVDFAVCTPSTCLPEQRTLALVLPVQ